MSWAVTVYEGDAVRVVEGATEQEVSTYFSDPRHFRANRPFQIDVDGKWSVPTWRTFLAWAALYPTVTTVLIHFNIDYPIAGLVLRALPTLRTLRYLTWRPNDLVVADTVDALARHPCIESFDCTAFDVLDLMPAILANASISSIHASWRNIDAALRALRDVRTLRRLDVVGANNSVILQSVANHMLSSMATVVVNGNVARDDPLANARHDAARKILVLCAHPALYDDGDHAIKRSIRDCMVAIGAPAGEIDDSDDDTVVLEDVVVIDDDDVL